MPLTIKGKVQGMEPLRQKLAAIGRKVERQATRKAVKAGNKVFLQSVKGHLKAHDTGALEMSLGDKVQSYRGGKVLVGVVGPRTGAVTTGRGAKRRRKLSRLGQKLEALGKKPSWYAHLVEGGTAPHSIAKHAKLARAVVIGKDGRVRRKAIQAQLQHMGRMHPGARAKPFVRPGYQSAESAALGAMTQVLSDEVKAAATG